MQVAPAILDIYQVSNDLVQQSFPLMGAADCKAAQGIGKTASGGNDLIIFIEHGTDIIKIRISLNALLL